MLADNRQYARTKWEATFGSNVDRVIAFFDALLSAAPKEGDLLEFTGGKWRYLRAGEAPAEVGAIAAVAAQATEASADAAAATSAAAAINTKLTAIAALSNPTGGIVRDEESRAVIIALLDVLQA